MKKVVFLTLIVGLLFPQVTNAAWWNPISWFTKEVSQPAQIDTSVESVQKMSTFYIKTDNVRVRACPSTSCGIIGYFKVNDKVDITESVEVNLDSIPEWVEIDIPDTGKGYVSKSLLSSNPVPVEEIAVKNNIEIQASLSAGLKIIQDWIDIIDTEIQLVKPIRDTQESMSSSYYTEEIVDTLNEYIFHITEIRQRLNSILGAIKSPSDLNIQVQQIDSLTSKFNGLKSQLLLDLQAALEKANTRARNDSSAKQRAISDAIYRKAVAQQEAINQASTDAANAYIEKYNAIRQQGSMEGATEAVVNAQLNSAGLIKQTNCYFSSVGGMTPGSGSVSCY